MKSLRLLAIGCLLVSGLVSFAQKTISEGTATYDIEVQPKGNAPKTTGGLNGAKTTVYLKGGLSRTDITSTLGTETTLYNAKTGTAAILKEYSGQKLMITLTKENWQSTNKKFDGVNFVTTAETKVIEGYNCKRAVAKLSDGSSVSVYYTPDLVPMNKEYSQAFKNLPGFPMEYEFETDKRVIKYLLSKIDFSPLPTSKFDFPKSGYRVMTYDENKSGKGEDH
ncbi:MAG: hypothetical protein ABIQ31_13100 [Ferruginibacter sp.]